ncbi:NADH pyrophosphatase [Oxobacter pfennigii]|uniref:NAD(+) diphosphatase n=1 Tax=Oxobacter pfennigii TaxID=36849 RepID=A0A0P8Z0R7_9CLOT|nr:NAD(+) diphosphatase [Oxobacter pfennigii]KPU45742.1 NADH pyrophosphatase [Oxobacter pfennigii]
MAEVSEEIREQDFSMKEMRPLLDIMDDELFHITGKAYQIMVWDNEHQYCGKCGAAMVYVDNERAKYCPQCGFSSYPRISPAIIVAITDNDRILLAHNKTFRNGMYSLIAGFVEPGETFEQCVEREVYEEVGLKIKNIKYFGSQPWPFPHSLMVGFTAQYESGDIDVDGKEIEKAGWFEPDELPTIPSQGSIARKLIDAYLKSVKK